jgi:L-ascorbate metabolism protein UlaG (beta-lactamase superfamily)
MKITKFMHACILVEHGGHVALFDPGSFSEDALKAATLPVIEDIFISHEHGDHISQAAVKHIRALNPNVRITSTPATVKALADDHIMASDTPPGGAAFFPSPHEGHPPFMNPPSQVGIHYLGVYSHPGDSHSFNETKAVLALPVTAPWGSTMAAVDVALKVKPTFIVPVHDWFWHDQARKAMYDRLETLFKEYGMTFLKLETGVPVEIEVE